MRPRAQILIAAVIAFILPLGLAAAAWAQDRSTPLPLQLPQAKELYQRVLTLPGASLVRSPDDSSAGSSLPVFSLFYVYRRDGNWIEVGRDLRRGPDGWISAQLTQDWSVMLTMQYAPPGQRNRVLFFEHERDLRDVVTAVDPAPLVKKLQSAADSGQPTDPPLASIEPSDAYGSQESNGAFYLIPIIGFSRAQFDDDRPATLLKVSVVNADPQAPPRSPQPPAPPPSIVQNMNGAIVFVLDTTISMQPYFERSVQSIRNILNELKAAGLDKKVEVGIVAYRNNIDHEPQTSGLKYVVKIVQPLDPKASLDQIMAATETLDEAKVSSLSFNEDAVAGLWTAITKLDWSPFENLPKLMFLVTDAGALEGDDPHAKFHGVDLLNVIEAAKRQQISVFPVHIADRGAIRFHNVEPTMRQYKPLGLTGDDNTQKYQLVSPGTPAQFDKSMTGLEKAMDSTFEQWAKKETIARPIVKSTDDTQEEFRKLVVNELFNAQQRYIGVSEKTRSKVVFNAWAVDQDLIDPEHTALRTYVFLTRDQLNQLAISATHIYDTARNRDISSDTMFRLLQTLSAQTEQDADRFKGDAAKVADMGLLPQFLTLLPYRSDFLQLTARDWAEKTEDKQAAALARLSFKIRAYQDMYADRGKWQDLGSGDPGQQVMAVPLEYLP